MTTNIKTQRQKWFQHISTPITYSLLQHKWKTSFHAFCLFSEVCNKNQQQHPIELKYRKKCPEKQFVVSFFLWEWTRGNNIYGSEVWKDSWWNRADFKIANSIFFIDNHLSCLCAEHNKVVWREPFQRYH